MEPAFRGASQIRQIFQSRMEVQAGGGSGGTAGALRLDWSSEGTLEWAPFVNGPWTELPDAVPPYDAPMDGGLQFYRIRQ